MLRLVDLAREPRGFARGKFIRIIDFAARVARSGRVPGVVNAVYSCKISIATAALTFHRKWVSAHEKIIGDGLLQLEIRHLAGQPRPGFGRVKNIIPLRSSIVNA